MAISRLPPPRALIATSPGAEMHLADLSKNWAVYDSYINRVGERCVVALAPKWQSRLAGFDLFIWNEGHAKEQSLRID